MRFLVAVLILTLAGCSTLDQALSGNGQITDSTSTYDGNRVVSMSPARVGHGLSAIPEMGLYWQTGYGDMARLVVRLSGITSFAPSIPALVKVDGNEIKMPPVNTSSIGDHTLSTRYTPASTVKEYWISRDEIRAIGEGSEGAYKLQLRGGYIDGEILYTGYGTMAAYIGPSFRKFYSTVWPD